MKKIFLLSFALFLCLNFAGVSGAAGQSKVFIAPMENNFNDFIVTAFIKNKVPVIITSSDAAADYVITSGLSKEKDKWYDAAFQQDHNGDSSPIKVLRQSDKSIVWNGTKDNKSFWGMLKNTVPDFWQTMKEIPQDEREKLANKFARQVKKEVFNPKK